jgi:multidrug resistance efflux pump
VLFEIDPVPYKYALETADSRQQALDGQIRDFRRAISAQNSAVSSAKANTRGALARTESRTAAEKAASAGVERPKQSRRALKPTPLKRLLQTALIQSYGKSERQRRAGRQKPRQHPA